MRYCCRGAQNIEKPLRKQVEADLGIALTKVTTITFKEDLQGGIEAHIEMFERQWEKMTTVASGSLKPAYLEAGKILQKMGHNELLKRSYSSQLSQLGLCDTHNLCKTHEEMIAAMAMLSLNFNNTFLR